jgi:hypothetical protein
MRFAAADFAKLGFIIKPGRRHHVPKQPPGTLPVVPRPQAV